MCFPFWTFSLRFALFTLRNNSSCTQFECSGFAFINFTTDWDDTSVTTTFDTIWNDRTHTLDSCMHVRYGGENPFNFMNLVGFPLKYIKHNFIHDYTFVSAVNIWMRWSKTQIDFWNIANSHTAHTFTHTHTPKIHSPHFQFDAILFNVRITCWRYIYSQRNPLCMYIFMFISIRLGWL